MSSFLDRRSEGGGSEFATWRERFDFFACYEAFAEVFGGHRVHVVPYEAYSENADELSAVFRKCCPKTTTTVSLKRIENQDRDFSEERRALLSTISDGARSLIQEAFADSNGNLAKNVEPRLASLGYVS